MEGAEAPDEFAAIDGDDAARGEGFMQRGDRPGIVAFAENREENDGIRDVEICVAGGEALAAAFDAAGHGERVDMQRGAVREAHRVKKIEVAVKRFEIRVVLVLLDGRQDGIPGNEACDVVHMAVGVVAFDAIAEPEDGFHAEGGAEFFFDRVAAEGWIAVGVEEAAFGGEERAFAVGVDRSALEDEVLEVEMPDAESGGDGGGDGVVFVEG